MHDMWKKWPNEQTTRLGFQCTDAAKMKFKGGLGYDHFGNLKIFLSQPTMKKVIDLKSTYSFTDCNGLGKCEIRITQGENIPETFDAKAEGEKKVQKKGDPLSSALGKGLGKFGKK